jgi:hypothetical protein
VNRDEIQSFYECGHHQREVNRMPRKQSGQIIRFYRKHKLYFVLQFVCKYKQKIQYGGYTK